MKKTIKQLKKERILKKELIKLDRLENKYQIEFNKQQIKANVLISIQLAKLDYNSTEKYKNYLKRAYDKAIVFELNLEYFNKLLSLPCTYCGSTPSNTIDRLDSKVGYTFDNSVACCKMCNMMKYTYDKDIFLNHIKKIYDFNNKFTC